MSTHECPKLGCGRQVPASQYACKPHWFSLPKALRDRIWYAFRSQDRDAHREALAAAEHFLNDETRVLAEQQGALL